MAVVQNGYVCKQFNYRARGRRVSFVAIYIFLYGGIRINFCDDPATTMTQESSSGYIILFSTVLHYDLSFIMISKLCAPPSPCFVWQPGRITWLNHIYRAVRQDHVRLTLSRLAPGWEASKRLEISPFIGILSGSLSFIPPSLSALLFAFVSDFLTF